jgi:peptidoglycan hydrolase-like protein with peptidoglycan-binding domain
MSKDQIKKVEEALQAKGHNPGRVDGVMDNQTQAAIRDFQKANSIPITGTLDQQTAQKLGVSLSRQSGGMSGDNPRASTDRSGSRPGYSGHVESGEDQNVPPGGKFKQSPR